jgi:hypothetical protein
MRFRWMVGFTLCWTLGACGGSTPRPKIEEVPIDQGDTDKASNKLPPDELSDASVARNVVSDSDASAPPGVGPQSLDSHAAQDAGAAPSGPPKFVKRPHGLTQRQCTDVVLHFAKLMAKEHKTPPPTAAMIPKDQLYGQMLYDCGQSTTHKQSHCAMTSRSTAGWKKCME